MAVTPTTRHGLSKQDAGDAAWEVALNATLDYIDLRLPWSYAGNPNTFVAGNYIGQPIFDLTNRIIYICTTTGVAASAVWLSMAPPAVDAIPTGTILDYAGATEPVGYLFCFGQAVSRTSYSALFTALSTTYGVGDGVTTFNLPDARGRVTAGQDDMGGTSANRLTGLSGGVDGDVLGGTGGEEAHALTSAESASHTHSGSGLTTTSDGAHTHSVTAVGSGGFVVTNTSGSSAGGPSSLTTSSSGAHTHSISGTTGSSGSGTAHNNIQPTLIINKIIKI